MARLKSGSAAQLGSARPRLASVGLESVNILFPKVTVLQRLIGLIGFIGLIGLIRLIGLIGFIGLIGVHK